MDCAENGIMLGLSEDGEEPEEDFFPACPGDIYGLALSFSPFLATGTTVGVVEYYPAAEFILSWLLVPSLSRRTSSLLD